MRTAKIGPDLRSDTRGTLTSPASDVHGRLKTNGTTIKIAKETTNKQ